MSPRKLNCTAETGCSAVSGDKLCSVSDLPDLSLTSQTGDEVPQDSQSKEDKPSEQLESNPSKSADEKPSKPSDGSNDILALANDLDSDDSEDEEYVPGVDPEEENQEEKEEKEGEEVISRQYSLRDGKSKVAGYLNFQFIRWLRC